MGFLTELKGGSRPQKDVHGRGGGFVLIQHRGQRKRGKKKELVFEVSLLPTYNRRSMKEPLLSYLGRHGTSSGKEKGKKKKIEVKNERIHDYVIELGLRARWGMRRCLPGGHWWIWQRAGYIGSRPRRGSNRSRKRGSVQGLLVLPRRKLFLACEGGGGTKKKRSRLRGFDS